MFYPGSRETTAVKRLQLFRGREIGAAFFFSSAADDSAGKLGTSLRGVSESSARILLRVSRRCHIGQAIVVFAGQLPQAVTITAVQEVLLARW